MGVQQVFHRHETLAISENRLQMSAVLFHLPLHEPLLVEGDADVQANVVFGDHACHFGLDVLVLQG